MELNAILFALSSLLSNLEKEIEKLPKKSAIIEETKNQTLKNYIMACESGGNKDAINKEDAKITGWISFGLYQFQFPTWFKAAKQYKIISETTTIEEGEKLYKDPRYNAAVAHALIDNGQTGHWKNCMQKFALR